MASVEEKFVEHPGKVYWQLYHHASRLHRTGERAAAERLYEAARMIIRHEEGRFRSADLTMAMRLEGLHRLPESRRVLRKVEREIREARRRHRHDPVNLGVELVNHASVYRNVGNYARAEELFREAVKRIQSVHQTRDRYGLTDTAVSSLTLVLQERRKFNEAEIWKAWGREHGSPGAWSWRASPVLLPCPKKPSTRS